MNNQEQFILSVISYYQSNNKDLSISRLVILLFLSDWLYTLKYGERLLHFNWKYRHFLETDELSHFLSHHKLIEITKGYNITDRIKLQSSLRFSTITDKKINFVFQNFIEKTFNQPFSQLCNTLIHSYPISRSTRYYEINLNKNALDYIKEHNHKKQ